MVDFLTGISPISLSATAVILIFIGAMIYAGKKQALSTAMLARAAVCVALSFLLSLITLYRMPQGGSVTPASMLPIMLFAYAYGPLPGIMAGAAFGLLKLIQDPFVVHPVQMLLDYPIAFACLGLAGCFPKTPLALGVLTASVGRFACAVISGAVFFAQYAGGANPWAYSAIYNLTYLAPDAIVCLVIALIPQVSRLNTTLRR